MTVKVTVVVPTYNSGSHLQPLIDSMLRQTLRRHEFEVLFVDDGSTDGTPDRIAALAAQHDHFRLIRIPNSGWPGKPRNVGVENANGTYVQFADHDDRMAPEALERLYAMGARNGSDVVIGKVASNFRSRGVPYGLMSRTREKCTVWNASLIDSLTPHKMFRTAFLREHGIVHPEGPWILEDQLFMVRAYLKASVVSVLGDYVCYDYWAREDTENAGTAAMEARKYYANLREIMATVVAGTEPGHERDRLLRRFYRVEMLSRAGAPARGVLHDPPFLDDPFDVLRGLAEEFITEGTHQGLAAVPRVKSTLLRANRPDDLQAFTRRQTELTADCAMGRTRWNRDRFQVAFSAGFTDVDTAAATSTGADTDPGTSTSPDPGTGQAGSPAGSDTGSGGAPGGIGEGLLLARRDDRYFLAPALTDGILAEPVDVTDELKSFRVDVLLRHTETAHLWVVPSETSLTLEEVPEPDCPATARFPGGVLVRPVVRGTFAIDPLRGAGNGPLGEGVWEVRMRVMGAGFDRYAGFRTAAAEPALPAPHILGGLKVTGGFDGDLLTLSIGATTEAPAPRPPKVSVVVATADASPDALRCTLESLTAQTMPADSIDVVVVGDEPSAGHRHVRPEPGTDPRNTGTDAAIGEYVLYLGAGDSLAAEALERMYDFGMEHDADIVAGKLAGRGRALPRELYARDRPRATLAKDPLADSLTADKMFHRAFLGEHNLRFPDRPTPLSEQEFTVRALLHAPAASVLGSYACYHYGSEGPKRPAAGSVPPAAFYGALGALADTANALSEPGAARDRLHRRWLRVEILDRLTGKHLLDLDENSRRELFEEARKAAARMSETAVAGLPVSRRLALGVLLDGRLDDLVTYAGWESSIACRARLDALCWQDDGSLLLGLTTELRAAEGPLAVNAVPVRDGEDGAADARSGSVRHTLAPVGLGQSLLESFSREPLTGAMSPSQATVVLILRERSSGAEYRLPTRSTVLDSLLDSKGELTVVGTAQLHPATAVDGAPLGDGLWDLYARLTALGWTKTARLGRLRGPAVSEQLSPVPHPKARDRQVEPYWTTPQQDLSLRVGVRGAPKPPTPQPAPAEGLLSRLTRRLRRP